MRQLDVCSGVLTNSYSYFPLSHYSHILYLYILQNGKSGMMDKRDSSWKLDKEKNGHAKMRIKVALCVCNSANLTSWFFTYQ